MDSISLQICSFPHSHNGFLGSCSQDKAESVCRGLFRPMWPWLSGQLSKGELVPKIRDHPVALKFLRSNPHHCK